jgi:hypothetical protein
MTITLELTDDVQQAIERKASKLGITAGEYLGRMAARAAKPTRTANRTQERKPKTPAAFLDELENANFPFGYGDPAIDSSELAHNMRQSFSNPSRKSVR